MQRISRTLGRRDQRACSLSRRQREGAARPHRNPAAPPLETLAPAFAVALPSLTGQPFNYSYEVNGEMLFELCAALVRMELGTPKLWSECGEAPLAFARCSIVNRIGKGTIELLERNVEYHLEVTDVAGHRAVLSGNRNAVLQRTRLRPWSDDTRFRFSLQFAGCGELMLIKPYHGASMRMP